VPRPGCKIHYLVPNPGNWYSFFALITDETDENFTTCSLCGEIQYYSFARKIQFQPFSLTDYTYLVLQTHERLFIYENLTV